MPDPAAQQAWKINALFVIVFVAHLIDIRFRLWGDGFGATEIIGFFILYLGIWLLTQALLPQGSGKKTAILAFSAWIIPIMGVLFASGLNDLLPSLALGDIFGVVLWFAPVWIISLMLEGGTKLTRFLGAIYLAFWLVILFINYSGLLAEAASVANLDTARFAPGFTIQTLFTQSWQGVKNFYSASKLRVNEAINETQQSYELAVYGDVYTGRVESQQGKRLGVDFGPLQIVQQNIRENSPVTVFARLQAQTLDSPVNIKLYCNCCDRESPKHACGAGGISGKGCTIRPKAEFIVTSQDSRDVECRFEKDVLEKGQQNINMRAVFSFTTSAYLRTYFMDAERVRASQRERINPLDQYKITNKAPIAIFTPGPVNIGMALSEAPLPIQIDRQEADKFLSLQISATNQWSGKISNIKTVTLFVPEGVEIVEVNGYS